MASLEKSLEQLDPSNDDDWTADGLPSVSRLKELTGSGVTRAEITEAAPTLTRETLAAVFEELPKPVSEPKPDGDSATLGERIQELAAKKSSIEAEIKILAKQRRAITSNFDAKADYARRHASLVAMQNARPARYQAEAAKAAELEKKVRAFVASEMAKPSPETAEG